MKTDLWFPRRLYALCLYLFPKNYREEYGEELQTVYDLSLEEAATKGGFEVAGVVLRELASLPKAVVIEHLRERRNAGMTRTLETSFNFVHGSWKEFLTVLLPFFLVGVAIPLSGYLVRLGFISPSGVLGIGIPLALFGLLIILLIVGMMKGMPRWSLPYLGFLLSILSVYLFSFILGTPIYFLFRNFRGESLLMDILWDGIFWYGLLTCMIYLVARTRTSPAFQYFRNDWTQLSFVLYGAAPFALWLTFDEYAGDEPYMLVAFLILAIGAWFYLRSRGEWTRFGTLFVAMTLAMFVAAAAKAILIPEQDWPFTIDQGLVVSEVKHTIIMWGWFAVGMLFPLAARFLPRSNESSHTTMAEG